MASVCFYFQVHQPTRVKRYRIFDIGHDHDYFNEGGETKRNNRMIIDRVAARCYLPTNAILLSLLRKYPAFKISFSFTGVLLEQLEALPSAVLDSFKALVDTGRVEILGETYYHSLSFIYSKEEFMRQVQLHTAKIKKVFGTNPQVFRNTELIYSNDIATQIMKTGFRAIIAEGADHVLQSRSPHFLYEATPSGLPLILKSYRLSDDIAFRFSNRSWKGYPVTAQKYAAWLGAIKGDVINLFMDFETFGEHHHKETGIFEFLYALPGEILKNPKLDFVTPRDEVARFKPKERLDVPKYMSWADVARDLSAWLSNPIQDDAIQRLYGLEGQVLRTKNKKILEDWRHLQTSDHFYYMCTKWFADGNVHKYFNPYESPYEAYIAYMNVLKDLELRISQSGVQHN